MKCLNGLDFLTQKNSLDKKRGIEIMAEESSKKFSLKNMSKKSKWITTIVVLLVVIIAGAGVGYKVYEDSTKLSGQYTYKTSEGTAVLSFTKSTYSFYNKSNPSNKVGGKYYVNGDTVVLMYDKNSTMSQQTGSRGTVFQLSNKHKTINLQGADFKK